MAKHYKIVDGPELLHCFNGGFRIPDDFKRREMKTDEDGNRYAPFKETKMFNLRRVKSKVAILEKPFWSERKAQRMIKEVLLEEKK